MDIKEPEPSIQKVDTKVSTIVDQIKNVLKGEQLTSENILKLTANTIKITEKLKDTTGVEKKTILLQSLSSIVDNQDIGDEKKIVIKSMIDVVVSSAIDVYVDIAKGKIKLPNNSACNLFKKCLCL
jgi:hypothetical protein